MSETCQNCGKQYDTIYRVPDEVWAQIAPQPETLGPYTEHQFGGLLCIDCARSGAEELGIMLYFEGNVGGWPEEEMGTWYKAAEERGWQGDLDDDCTLRRYGMVAHVENLTDGVWWFGIYDEQVNTGLYNAADIDTLIPLKTGEEARVAAEHCLEVFNMKVSLL